MTFADAFRIARRKSKLSLRDIESVTGISNAFLSQVEHGKELSFSRAARLALLLDFSLDEIASYYPEARKKFDQDKTLIRKLLEVNEIYRKAFELILDEVGTSTLTNKIVLGARAKADEVTS